MSIAGSISASTDPMIRGLVSIIIPVHNRPGLLVEAVSSALAQTYRPIEVIVVDDGSTDETGEVAKNLARRHADEIQLVRRSNGGPGSARESGRQTARGEFIQYLDSDDLLLPEKLELQVAALNTDPESGVCYGITQIMDPSAAVSRSALMRTGEAIECMFPSFFRARWWHTSTPLYRRSVSDEAGPWAPLRVNQDWEYDCRIAANHVRLCYVPHPVSIYRQHHGSRVSQDILANREKLKDRAIAHELVLQHAVRAGLTPKSPEMKRFARTLFLVCRQCGAAGLEQESRRLFELAWIASEDVHRHSADLRVYGHLARIVGWRNMGSLVCAMDRCREAMRRGLGYTCNSGRQLR